MTPWKRLRCALISWTTNRSALERLERMLAGFPRLRSPARPPTRRRRSNSSTVPSEQPIDVLFLDIQMPGMNGFELLSRLNVAALCDLHNGL